MSERTLEIKQALRNWWVTIGIIALNIIIAVVVFLGGDTNNAVYMIDRGALYAPAIVENGEYWRFLSAAFLHFGFMHLLHNMFMFACIGPYLEKAMGHVRFLLLYLLSALAGTMLSFASMRLETGEGAGVSAGASGAIFGVMGGLFWVVIRNKGKYEGMTFRGFVIMIVLCLYYGIATAGVDNWAHIGGILMGFLSAIILYRKRE